MVKKLHKKIPKKLTYTCHSLKFGSYGVKILKTVRLTREQLDSLNRTITKKLNCLFNYSKKYKWWVLIQLNSTLTKLSLESRMGKGKGLVYTKVVFLKKGSIIYEFQNIKLQQAEKIFYLIKMQLGINLALVIRK